MGYSPHSPHSRHSSRSSLRLGRTPEGRRFELSRVVGASADAVWALLTTPDRWPEWGPSVDAVDCAADRIGPGTTGRARVLGRWIPFEVETCTDYRWTWRVAGVPATGHRVEPLGDRRCRVVFEIPLVAAGYALVCERALGNIDRLAAETP